MLTKVTGGVDIADYNVVVVVVSAWMDMKTYRWV